MAAKPQHPHNLKGQDKVSEKTLDNKGKSALKRLNEAAWEKKKAEHPTLPVHAIPKPNYRERTANDLQKSVKAFLQLEGWQAERISIEGRVIDSRRTVKDILGRKRTLGNVTRIPTSGQVGSADLSATILGRSVKIEIKIGQDVQSPRQQEYQRQVQASGGVYLLIGTFQEFYDWYQDFIEGVSMDTASDITLPKPFKTSNAQFEIVYNEFFRQPQTMKQVSVNTGIDRANICWYARELRKSERIKSIGKTKCPITRHEANVWTTDPAQFPVNPQLSLFVTK